jgi:hypothetical protein
MKADRRRFLAIEQLEGKLLLNATPPPHFIPVDNPVEATPSIVVKMEYAIADPPGDVSYESALADSCVGPVRGVVIV